MIAAIALGGVAGIDRTAFAQTMFAHPVVQRPASGNRLRDVLEPAFTDWRGGSGR
jgi:hypothetical protein